MTVRSGLKLDEPRLAYVTVAVVGAVAGRTRPQIDTFEPTRLTASGSRKAGSDGFGLPSAKRSPDSKPAYWFLPVGSLSRRRYCENATTRGLPQAIRSEIARYSTCLASETPLCVSGVDWMPNSVR